MRMYFRFAGIDDCHLLTKQTDCNFIFLAQHAVLLGLKDAELLTEMQYRQAEEALLGQYREDIKSIHYEASSID